MLGQGQIRNLPLRLSAINLSHKQPVRTITNPIPTFTAASGWTIAGDAQQANNIYTETISRLVQRRSSMFKKAAIYSLFALWLFVLILELLIWADIRDAFFSQQPLIETVSSFLRDLLWVPIALALPFYLSMLVSKMTLSGRLRVLRFLACGIVLVVGLFHLQSFFRYLIFLVIPFLALLLFSIYQFHRARIDLVFFSITLLGLMVNYRGQTIPGTSFYHKKAGTRLTMMTYNIHVRPSKEKRLLAIETIRREKPDIAFIQEINSQDRKLFWTELGALYPHQLWSDRFETYLGGVILSRFPFTLAENIDIKTSHASGHTNLNHAIIRLGEKEIHLFNCHLFPSGHEFIQVLIGRIGMAEFLDDARKVYLRRRDEAEQIAERAAKLHGPVILAGDFNDTPNSFVYRLFIRRFKNAHSIAGWGLGSTFGKDILLYGIPRSLEFSAIDFLRIDHVFCSNEFTVLSSTVLPVEASDHKAQVVELELEK